MSALDGVSNAIANGHRRPAEPPHILVYDGNLIHAPDAWKAARERGLTEQTYARTWWVYATLDEYRESRS